MSDGGPLSTWKALIGGTPRRRRFVPRDRLFELSNRILKCLDAANRPYAEVLRLGLCPKDWLNGEDAVPTNTLKAANSFLSALRHGLGGEVGRRAKPSELEAAWAKAPVPGHPDAASFARSPLGAAILARLAGEGGISHVSADLLDLAGDLAGGEDDLDLMKPAEAVPFLDAAVKGAAISLEERDLLAAILAGEKLSDLLRNSLTLRRRLRDGFGNDVQAYVSDLSERTAAFVSAL
jgi:hypothetical protein